MNDKPVPPADLRALLEGVHDELTFGSFVRALAADFEADRELLAVNPEKYKYSAGPLGWQVGTISDLLYNVAGEAGRRRPLAPPDSDNPWKRCAQMLWVAKIME